MLWRVQDPLGVADLGGGRAGAVRGVSAGGRVAAGFRRASAAGGGADRAEPAGVVRLRAGIRPGPVRAPSFLAGQRGVVRVDHPRRAAGAAGGGVRGAWRSIRGPVRAAVVAAGPVLGGGLLPVDPVGGAPTAQLAAIQGNVPRARNLSQQLSATEVTQNHVEATLKLA